MAKCAICEKDNMVDSKLILVKIGNNFYCGHCATIAIKRKVKEK